LSTLSAFVFLIPRFFLVCIARSCAPTHCCFSPADRNRACCEELEQDQHRPFGARRSTRCSSLVACYGPCAQARQSLPTGVKSAQRCLGHSGPRFFFDGRLIPVGFLGFGWATVSDSPPKVRSWPSDLRQLLRRIQGRACVSSGGVHVRGFED